MVEEEAASRLASTFFLQTVNDILSRISLALRYPLYTRNYINKRKVACQLGAPLM